MDQPEVEKGVTRVSGPFTMEAVMPAELSDDDVGFEGAPEELGTFDPAGDEANAEGFVERKIRLLEKSDVRFGEPGGPGAPKAYRRGALRIQQVE